MKEMYTMFLKMERGEEADGDTEAGGDNDSVEAPVATSQ